MHADTPAHTADAPHVDHPHTHTADAALAYVADAPELRTPSERALAGEVVRLRAVLDESESVAALGWHLAHAAEVASAWSRGGLALRFSTSRIAGYPLVAALDALTEMHGLDPNSGKPVGFVTVLPKLAETSS